MVEDVTHRRILNGGVSLTDFCFKMMFSGCYLGNQPKVEGEDQLGSSWQQLRQEVIRMETREVAGGRVRSNRRLEIFNVPAAFC